MTRTRITRLQPVDDPKTFSFQRRLKEIDMFFQGNDPVHQTMKRLVRRLEKAGVPYAIVGAMALNAHRYRRTTDDVNILLTPEGLAEFRRRFVDKYYLPIPGRARRFTERKSQVTIDFLLTGNFPGSGKPGPISFPDPSVVGEVIKELQYIDLVTLIQLKLAARRHRDFGDVVELIRIHQLDESYLNHLDPSVRGDYIECLEEKRREEEYEARNG